MWRNAPIPLSMIRNQGCRAGRTHILCCWPAHRPPVWPSRIIIIIITASRWCRKGRRGRRWRKTSTSKCPPWWKRCRRRTLWTREGRAVDQQPVQKIGRDRKRSEVNGARWNRLDPPPYWSETGSEGTGDFVLFFSPGRFSRQNGNKPQKLTTQFQQKAIRTITNAAFIVCINIIMTIKPIFSSIFTAYSSRT